MELGEQGTMSRVQTGWAGGSSETAKDNQIYELEIQGKGPSLRSDFGIH